MAVLAYIDLILGIVNRVGQAKNQIADAQQLGIDIYKRFKNVFPNDVPERTDAEVIDRMIQQAQDNITDALADKAEIAEDVKKALEG